MDPTSNIPKSPTLGNKPLPTPPVRGTPSEVRQSQIQSADSVASKRLSGAVEHQPNVKTPHHRLGALNPETLRETEKFLVKTGKQAVTQVKTGAQSLWKASKELILKKGATEDPVAQLKYAKQQLEDVEKNTNDLEWNLKALNKQIDGATGKLNMLVFDSHGFESSIDNKKLEIGQLNEQIKDIAAQKEVLIKQTGLRDPKAKEQHRELNNDRLLLIAEKNAIVQSIKMDEDALTHVNREIEKLAGVIENLGQQKVDLEKAVNSGRSEIALINTSSMGSRAHLGWKRPL